MVPYIKHLVYPLQLVFLLPVIWYWYDQRGGTLDNLDVFAIFPLLGLVAFTMMWWHLMVAWMKRVWPDAYNYSSYYKITGNIVLVLILLHPILLFSKMAAYDYVAPDNKVFVNFGLLALVIFLVYEVIERLKSSSFVKNNQAYIAAANRIGFILVFFHGLQLGQHLQTGWLRGLWIFYGLSSLAYFVYAYYSDIKRDKGFRAE